jgi:hypothetical protein
VHPSYIHGYVFFPFDLVGPTTRRFWVDVDGLAAGVLKSASESTSPSSSDSCGRHEWSERSASMSLKSLPVRCSTSSSTPAFFRGRFPRVVSDVRVGATEFAIAWRVAQSLEKEGERQGSAAMVIGTGVPLRALLWDPARSWLALRQAECMHIRLRGGSPNS